MKTGIFETQHFEGAYPVIKLFDNDKNDVVIFTYEEPYQQFKHLFAANLHRYEWIVKQPRQSKYSFIRKMYAEAKKRKLDVLYLNGITDNYLFYAIMALMLRHARVILTIHCINSYFELKKPLTFRKLVRYIGRKMLLSAVKEFNVVSITMINYLKSKLPADKKVHCIPGAVFEGRAGNPSAHMLPVRIVIPGSIDGRRRDYRQAIALVNLLEEKKLPVTMTFLGWFYGKYGEEILGLAQKLNLQFVTLNYYDPASSVVEQPEFDKVMDEADIVLLPAVISTVMEDDVAESYGISLCSGTLFDIIKHAKPFIIPHELAIDPFLEKSCVRYNSINDILSFLLAIQHDPSLYERLHLEAYEASRHYTIEKVRERNPGIFQ